MEYLIGYDSDGRVNGFYIIDHPMAARPTTDFVQVTQDEYNNVYGRQLTHYLNGEFVKQETAISDEHLSANARGIRNSLLTASDWTQLPDVPKDTRKKWADYRQKLRDISSQPGFPASVVWPEKP